MLMHAYTYDDLRQQGGDVCMTISHVNTYNDVTNTYNDVANTYNDVTNTYDEVANTYDDVANTYDDVENTYDDAANTCADTSKLERWHMQIYMTTQANIYDDASKHKR